MQDSEIINKVLIHLQGYSIESDELLSDLEYDKQVSKSEVLSFVNLTKSYACSYINQSTLPTITVTINDEKVEQVDPIVCDAVCMWTAGKIWQKYNVRVNNNEDDTTPFGYGDKLVIQAKEMLKPYKYYDMKVY